MKILFATLFFPPTHIGGTETYTHARAKSMQQLGHEVRVVCVGDWEKGTAACNGFSDETYEGVPVRRVHLNWTKMPNVNRSLYDNSVIAKFFEGVVREWQPDVVHATSCQTLSAGIITGAKRAGVPVVVSLGDYWFLCPRVTLLRGDGEICDGQVEDAECIECMLSETKLGKLSRELLPNRARRQVLTLVSRQGWLTGQRGLRGMVLDIHERRVLLHDALEQADCRIAPSQFVKNSFTANHFRMPIQVNPLGIDMSWLSTYRGKTPTQTIRFGFIGQIIPIKGIHHIIQAFNMLPEQSAAELYIYGGLDKDPAYTQELRDLANGQTLIHFAGSYQHAELARVFSEMDVMVFASMWHETYGLVVQEAFAAGTPVIASNVGAIPEAVQDEKNGLLFEAGDVAGLAHQMKRILEDRELLPRLVAGIPQVKSMECEGLELERIYNTISKRIANQ